MPRRSEVLGDTAVTLRRFFSLPFLPARTVDLAERRIFAPQRPQKRVFALKPALQAGQLNFADDSSILVGHGIAFLSEVLCQVTRADILLFDPLLFAGQLKQSRNFLKKRR